MTKDDAIKFLTHDQEDGTYTGYLKVPCSRYGNNGEECAEVAWKAFKAIEEANGPADDGKATLDWLMGLAVNDHDDIQYLIDEYWPGE